LQIFKWKFPNKFPYS